MKSTAPVTGAEKRIHIRFDKIFSVVLGSELYGETVAVARNISGGGMLVQAAEILPLGSVVTVHFPIGDSEDELVARAEVKHHLCLNFTTAAGDEPRSARAMGLRFLDFDTNLPLSLPATRVLH
ncbi:MAG: PilZ domain-containing protein [Kofleriaceae bacterium]|nr:PilZ domain-containing protein [Kofleriaceae bacterium]MCL4228927.1 PilZ domain-containing protein [Myxococcales bacterium]